MLIKLKCEKTLTYGCCTCVSFMLVTRSFASHVYLSTRIVVENLRSHPLRSDALARWLASVTSNLTEPVHTCMDYAS